MPQKPYGEGEWHTVLYNCSTPEIPSEELCASPARCAAENEVFGGKHKVHKAFVIICGKELAYFVAASTVMEIDWQWDSLRIEILS